MTTYPREHQDQDCGCAWRTDPFDQLCHRCRPLRRERDEQREREANYTDED